MDIFYLDIFIGVYYFQRFCDSNVIVGACYTYNSVVVDEDFRKFL